MSTSDIAADSAQSLPMAVGAEPCVWRAALPQCPHCGALARPNILPFNAALAQRGVV